MHVLMCVHLHLHYMQCVHADVQVLLAGFVTIAVSVTQTASERTHGTPRTPRSEKNHLYI